MPVANEGGDRHARMYGGKGFLPVCVLIANHLLGARRTQLNTIPPCTCGATATITVMVTANE